MILGHPPTQVQHFMLRTHNVTICHNKFVALEQQLVPSLAHLRTYFTATGFTPSRNRVKGAAYQTPPIE
ncbi:hypothetical protein ERY430_70152 [Erythrobacter sp. EC-HK427]|nr:hypothetical protein ERY430_70152 [Erythrobacter sp. EC-HK427]